MESSGGSNKCYNNGGRTHLHWSAIKGQKQIAELLINEGADVNLSDDNGTTPLHFTALMADKRMAELLIAKGANINTKNDDGETPLDYFDFDKYKPTETADLLRKHGGKTREELKAAGN